MLVIWASACPVQWGGGEVGSSKPHVTSWSYGERYCVKYVGHVSGLDK